MVSFVATVVKHCHEHGPLTADQCYTHKRKARLETGAKARTDYDCRRCLLAYRKSPEQSAKRRFTRKSYYESEKGFREDCKTMAS